MDRFNLPNTFKVDVDFYNDDEKQKLEAYPSSEFIEKVAGKTIEIPTSDFLTYYLFYKKTPGKAGYSNFEEISEKYHHSLSELDGYFEIKDGSLRTNISESFKNAAVSERIGEAIGISVVNEIHGLSRADWNKIPEIGGREGKKTLDYELGSDGKHIIHIENKGSLVEKNSMKSSGVSNHKESIVKKKEAIRGDSAYPYPSNIMYGTIGAIDSDIDRNAKCWLLDPEPESVDIEPEKLRLLNRYDYLLSIIRMISPRSQLTTALTTRFYDLLAIKDYRALDSLPVRMADGKNFPDFSGDYSISPLYAGNKSRLTDGESIGKVVAYGEAQLLYIGIDMSAINIMVDQNFDKVISYSNKRAATRDSVRCSFGITQQRQLRDRIESYFSYDSFQEKKVNYLYFKANTIITRFQEGLIFGVLESENN